MSFKIFLKFQYFSTKKKRPIRVDFIVFSSGATNTSLGANEVVIYNFLALLTIDTNINQLIKLYHIFDKLQFIIFSNILIVVFF